MITYLLVFLGGGLGSLCRFGIARALLRYPWAFPVATLLANVLACVVLGYLTALAGRQAVGYPHRHLWMVGFCGGFSTFSTFSGETFALLQSGQAGLALLNVLLSLLSCLGALALGYWLAGGTAS